MATYATELEALNAIYDLLDAVNTDLATVKADVTLLKADVADIKGYIDGIEGKIDTTNTTLTTTNGKLDTLHADVDQVEAKLDTANTNLTEIIGETIDIRNIPTDTCIIRVYIGDRTDKREAASKAVTKLLSDGYRPYMVMGISEDLARVLFVKYPAPNTSVEPEPGL